MGQDPENVAAAQRQRKTYSLKQHTGAKGCKGARVGLTDVWSSKCHRQTLCRLLQYSKKILRFPRQHLGFRAKIEEGALLLLCASCGHVGHLRSFVPLTAARYVLGKQLSNVHELAEKATLLGEADAAFASFRFA